MAYIRRSLVLLRLLSLSGLGIVFLMLLLPTPVALASVMNAYGGSEYEGRVDTHILLPDGRRHTLWGRGTARLVETAPGKAQLILQSKVIDDESGAEIKLDGSYDASGWRSDASDLDVSISPDGRISGGGNSGGQTFTFSGEFSAGRALLETTVHMDSATSGLPAGSTLTHDYRLQRDAPRTAASESESADGRRCKRMGMRNVVIAGLGGAAMSMATVPECQEYE